MVRASVAIANHRFIRQEISMNRHFMVTGGTGALGAAVVPALLRHDARLTVPSVDQASASRLLDSLPDVDKARVVIKEADLRDEASVIALVAGVPPVDVLIHLAGSFAMGVTDGFSLADFRQQIDLNLTSLFLMTRAVLPATYSRQDAIFNVQRSALLIAALTTGEVRAFPAALEDRFHQPYRYKLVPGLEDMVKLRAPGLLGCALSGAGPSILVFYEKGYEPVCDLVRQIFALHGKHSEILWPQIPPHGYVLGGVDGATNS